jgi:ATP-dependent Lhr-like helicase
MSLPPLKSDLPEPQADRQASSAFWLLHEKVRRWIWEQRWEELRDIQEQAIRTVLEKDDDVLISAATARGKTEAAFLPICSTLVEDAGDSIRALYIGPLKALINDQFERLERLCEHLDIPVHRWHGDVDAGRKKRVLTSPAGILLITPESLEALFVLHGPKLPIVFRELSFIVVDELHAFVGNERGRQLQSLLHRLEFVLRRRIRRLALSATLGDMKCAARYLRPGDSGQAELVVSSGGDQEIKLQVRGYTHQEPYKETTDTEEEDLKQEKDPYGDRIAIAEHLFTVLRGSDNLVFCNSRHDVEVYADLLRRLCERDRVPNEFLPHHGSISREIREDVEARLKDKSLPQTVVCTTTLELGIDIGSVASIAQVGVPFTVASLRQRLGRSGRRGEPAVLRMYIQEKQLRPDSPLQDMLRPHVVQAVAMVRLLVEKWYEPPILGALHLSTLVQQILSVIAQYGGARAQDIWQCLCRTGPFAELGQEMFGSLLRTLATHELLVQSGDGTLLLGLAGERLVNHYSFYAAFSTTEEFRLIADGKLIGSLPIAFPLAKGGFLIFAGRRWEVMSVDLEHKLIELKAAAGGRAPTFVGSGAWVHDRVREEMFRVYTFNDVPTFVDTTCRSLLMEGRKHFLDLRLRERSIIAHGQHTLLFVWKGDRILNTLLVQLRAMGLEVTRDSIALTISRKSRREVLDLLKALTEKGPADPTSLADAVVNKATEKYDRFLDASLLNADYASRYLDCPGAWETICRLSRALPAHASETV